MIAPFARRVGASLAGVVAALSGAYVFVYLYRWEWNRAVISGFVFLAVVVVWSAVAVARRMQRLEATLTGLFDGMRNANAAAPQVLATDDGEDVGAAAAVRATAAGPPRFAWLADDMNRLSVFVPVLLGSGVVLSGAAWLVERLAGAVAGRGGRGGRHRAHARGRRIVAAVVVVLGTAVGVEAVRRATQSDPAELVRPGVTVMVVDLETRDGRRLDRVAEALWVACSGRVPHDLALREVTAAGSASASESAALVRLELDGALGVTGRRRVEGCFEDLTVDRVLADVVEVRATEAGTSSARWAP